MRTTLLALAFIALPGAVYAQSTTAPNAPDDRFQIEQRGDVIVRLDRKTGTMSTCTLSGSTLDCRAGADERAALQDEIDRLAGEVDRLTAQAGGTPKTGITKDGRELTLKLPSEEEVQGVITYLEDAFRRLVEAVRNLNLGGDKA